METIHIHIHHTATPTGELLGMACPYCSKEIELRAKLQSDNDIITLDYGKDNELLHALRDELT
jgi:hypothetical protein